MTEYASGTPSWCDLASPDPDASIRFYGELFGWTAGEPSEEGGGYRLLFSDGRTVGGLMPLMNEQQPPVWSAYVATDSADGVAQRVGDAGGAVILGPMDVMDAGRLVVFAAPEGSVLGAWEPGANRGAEKAREPGGMCWIELGTRDVDAAQGFYSAVFGWSAEPFPGADYTVFSTAGTPIGGALPMPEQVPAEVPSHWTVYFAVTDADGTVARAQEIGGQLRVGPEDIPDVGRFAYLVDPHGSQFAVLQPQMPDE
jgi:predicted enzyme related to lactoylglutathione lyase